MNKLTMKNEGQMLDLDQYLEMVDTDEKELVTELFNQTSITELLTDHEMIMDGDEYFI